MVFLKYVFAICVALSLSIEKNLTLAYLKILLHKSDIQMVFLQCMFADDSLNEIFVKILISQWKGFSPVCLHMPKQMKIYWKIRTTDITVEWFFSCVCPHVLNAIRIFTKFFHAHHASPTNIVITLFPPDQYSQKHENHFHFLLVSLLWLLMTFSRFTILSDGQLILI